MNNYYNEQLLQTTITITTITNNYYKQLTNNYYKGSAAWVPTPLAFAGTF